MIGPIAQLHTFPCVFKIPYHRQISGLLVQSRCTELHLRPFRLIFDAKPGLEPHHEHRPPLHLKSFRPALIIESPNLVARFLDSSPILLFHFMLCFVESLNIFMSAPQSPVNLLALRAAQFVHKLALLCLKLCDLRVNILNNAAVVAVVTLPTELGYLAVCSSYLAFDFLCAHNQTHLPAAIRRRLFRALT